MIECSEREICADGVCEAPDPCEAACLDLECGDGGVEGCECGLCVDGYCGEDGLCVLCTPSCSDEEGNIFECGSDGCDGDCGACDEGDKWGCVDHFCVCTPDCEGKVCGSDGCGGSCGDCGDGEECGLDSQCYASCWANEAPVYSDDVLKINSLVIGDGGYDGMAIDVDNDPETCAPEGACENGLNNQLGGLLTQIAQYVDANAELEDMMIEGSFVLLGELIEPNLEGEEFPMNLYIGVPKDAADVCDWQVETCDYLVKPDSYDIMNECKAMISFDNASVVDGKLLAGGPDGLFSIAFPVVDGLILTLHVHMATLVGDAVIEEGKIVGVTGGLIGGAVPKALIMETIDNLPPDVLADLQVSVDMIKGLLDVFIQNDIDTDGDGELDAASLGIQFEMIAGKIVGLEIAE